MTIEPVKAVTLPYIQEWTDPDGRTWRYVRKGKKRVRLKLEPDDPSYLNEYQAAVALIDYEPGSTASAPGTWHALIDEYLESSAFLKKVKTPKSREERKRACKLIRAKWGAKHVSGCRREDVERWQDKLMETPGKANNLLRAIKKLLAFGEGRGFTFDRSILKIEKLELGAWRSWTDLEMQKFVDTWALGTRERLIFDLALYTGQRKADLMDMTREHLDGDIIGVAQQKTGERLAIQLHPYLKGSLKAFKSNGLAIIQDGAGQPMTSRSFHDAIATAIDAAGLPTACVLHGLRKAAARRLAEAGASTQEIMAITGHRTLGMIEHYTRGANQKKLAKSAILKLWRDRKKERNEN